MNKLLVGTLLLSACHLPISTYADDIEFDGEVNGVATAGESSVAGLGAIIGGFAAGPVGFILGAAGGMSLGQELADAKETSIQYEELSTEHMKTEDKLSVAHQRIDQLENRLASTQEYQQVMHQLAMTRLELQVLFHTGTDELDRQDLARLDELATFLLNNPELNVLLHGHADPRGDEVYNQQLSQQRSRNVQRALEQRGVDSSRIERLAYGETVSEANTGDLDAYALERRVSIEVFSRDNDDLAVAH